jgi:hypothetical protein
MIRILALAAAGAALAGCGIAAKVEARNDYQASSEQYKACLAANASAPQNCEGLRLAMEADERKFQNMSAGASGGSRSGAVTILNR